MPNLQETPAGSARTSAAAELGGLDERSERAIAHGGDNDVSFPEHAELLRRAGFSEVGAAWRSGDDAVLVALR